MKLVRRALMATALLSLVACGASPGSTAASPTSAHLSISGIRAVFSMRSYSTTYTVEIHPARAQSTTLTATWTIRLQMVDPPGASDPILPDGSAAALDPRCNNDGLGAKAPYIDPNASRGNVSRFTWIHPGVGLDPGA